MPLSTLMVALTLQAAPVCESAHRAPAAPPETRRLLPTPWSEERDAEEQRELSEWARRKSLQRTRDHLEQLALLDREYLALSRSKPSLLVPALWLGGGSALATAGIAYAALGATAGGDLVGAVLLGAALVVAGLIPLGIGLSDLADQLAWQRARRQRLLDIPLEREDLRHQLMGQPEPPLLESIPRAMPAPVVFTF